MADDGFRKAMGNIRKRARNDREAADGREEDLFWLVYIVANRREDAPKENWAQNTGKTWKSLVEFPGRLRRMAEEVEHLSRSHFFDPRAITSEIPLAIFAKREFSILPVTLKNYASWLEEQAGSISAYRKYFYLSPSRERSFFIYLVSEQVKLITGRFCDPEVAELLNAADLLLNPDKTHRDKGFDAPTLALLRARWKRKVPKT